MDLKKLEIDWRSDPCLERCNFRSVEELAQKLIEVHRYLMSPESGPLGYLYQAQVRRAKGRKE